MLCRACGMQNQNPQATVCEWCKRPMTPAGNVNASIPRPSAPSLNAVPAPPPNPNSNPAMPLSNTSNPSNTSGQPAPTARIQRRTLTGELIEVEVPATPPSSMPATPPVASMHAPPATPAIGAPYAAMHSAGASYHTMAPQMLRDAAPEPRTTPLERWECFLAIASPILLLSGLLIHFNPGTIWWMTFLDLFVLSVALGGSGAVPSYDDAYFDVAVMLVVTFLFGPLIALLVYLLTAAVKQECNTAVVGLLTLQLLIFQGMPMVFLSHSAWMKHIGAFMIMGMLNGMAVFVAFLGWLLSNFFRPVVE